jgi:hypothetical protein
MVEKEQNKRELAKHRTPINLNIELDDLRKLSKSKDPVERIQVADFIGKLPVDKFNTAHGLILKALAFDKDVDVSYAATENMSVRFSKLSKKSNPNAKGMGGGTGR